MYEIDIILRRTTRGKETLDGVSGEFACVRALIQRPAGQRFGHVFNQAAWRSDASIQQPSHRHRCLILLDEVNSVCFSVKEPMA